MKQVLHILATIVAVCAAIGCLLEGFSGQNKAALGYCAMLVVAAVIAIATDDTNTDAIN